MGQQPNLELGLNDSPRSTPAPGVARRWRPWRPGELTKPADVPTGGPFGVIGPNAGYALKLVAEHKLKLIPGEHHHDVAAALAAIATARAGAGGRAPTADDVTVAMIVLGLDSATAGGAGPMADRPGWIANVGHDDSKLRRLVADIPSEILSLAPDDVRERVASGWTFRG